MRATTSWLLVAVGLLVSSSAAAADYGVKGTVATTTTNLKPLYGATGGKLVVPNAPGTYPLIVASHGFSANADNQVGWAEHFASYGFVVVVPSFPSPFSPDHAKNGAIVKSIVTGIAAEDTPAKGKVDATRVGLEGHSAGGLATTIAAADVKPGATVLFDPVDNGGLGKTAYAKLCGPVVSLFAAPSSCNSNTGWFDFRTTALGPTTSFRVKGATHCDGENAPRMLCGFTCGGAADPARQKLHARYATAFFLAHLKGDADAASQLTSAALAADSAIGEVSVGGGPSCVTPPAGDAGTDAGAPDASGDDASTGDDASSDDASTGADASPADGSTASDTGSSGEEPLEPTASDGGCGCSVPRSPRAGLGVAGLALALFAARRRRQSVSR